MLVFSRPSRVLMPVWMCSSVLHSVHGAELAGETQAGSYSSSMQIRQDKAR